MKERAIDFKHPLAIGDFAMYFLPSEFHAHITYRKNFSFIVEHTLQRGKIYNFHILDRTIWQKYPFISRVTFQAK